MSRLDFLEQACSNAARRLGASEPVRECPDARQAGHTQRRRLEAPSTFAPGRAARHRRRKQFGVPDGVVEREGLTPLPSAGDADAIVDPN